MTLFAARRYGGVFGVWGDDDDDDDVFYFDFFSCKQKTMQAELHIVVEEGTYHKRLFRGPSTYDMKK